MADTIEEVRRRLAELKSQGKTASTSKEIGKLTQRIGQMKAGTYEYPDTGSNFYSDASRTASLARDLAQPAISKLEEGIQPLQERFAQVAADIKEQGEISRQSQELATTNELGRRGILPSSGLAQQQIAQSTRPITAQTQSTLGQLGLGQEQQMQAIRSAMANLLAPTGQTGINTALSLAQLGNQQEQNRLSNALATNIFENVTLPQSQANIRNIESLIGNRTSVNTGLSPEQILLGFLEGQGGQGMSTAGGTVFTMPDGTQLQLPSSWQPE